MGIRDWTNNNKTVRDTLPVQRHTLLLAAPVVHHRLRITPLPIQKFLFSPVYNPTKRLAKTRLHCVPFNFVLMPVYRMSSQFFVLGRIFLRTWRKQFRGWPPIAIVDKETKRACRKVRYYFQRSMTSAWNEGKLVHKKSFQVQRFIASSKNLSYNTSYKSYNTISVEIYESTKTR